MNPEDKAGCAAILILVGLALLAIWYIKVSLHVW